MLVTRLRKRCEIVEEGTHASFIIYAQLRVDEAGEMVYQTMRNGRFFDGDPKPGNIRFTSTTGPVSRSREVGVIPQQISISLSPPKRSLMLHD